MEPDIIKSTIDWTEIKNHARVTMGKDATDKPPSNSFKERILIAEHSVIREGWIKWTWKSIKSWISVHFSRHWLGWNKYISTQRNDRTDGDIDRNKSPQDTPVKMDVSANLQALINVARFRLCYMASPETREYMESLKKSVKERANEPEVAFVMQKNCIYRGGCPEMKSCGYWKQFCEKHKDADLLDIKTRYKLADEDFYS